MDNFAKSLLSDPEKTLQDISVYFDDYHFPLLKYSSKLGSGKQGTVYRYNNLALKVVPYTKGCKVRTLSSRHQFLNGYSIGLPASTLEVCILYFMGQLRGVSIYKKTMIIVTDYYSSWNESNPSFDDVLWKLYEKAKYYQSNGYLVHGDAKFENIVYLGSEPIFIDFGHSSYSISNENNNYRLYPEGITIVCQISDLSLRYATYDDSLRNLLNSRNCSNPYYSSFNLVTLLISYGRFPETSLYNYLLSLMIHPNDISILKTRMSNSNNLTSYNNLLSILDGIKFRTWIE
jgi:hypothetical protein